MNLFTYDCPSGTPESKYFPLDVMSDFSMGESVARIPNLVKKAKALNMKALALADRTLSGAIEFHEFCRHNNIKPIIGQKIAYGNNEVTLLCKNFEAYKILCKYSLEFQKANNCPISVTELPLSKYEASHFICTTLHADSKLQELFGENLYRQIDFTDLKTHPEKADELNDIKGIITSPVRFIEKEDADALAAMKQYLGNPVTVDAEHYFKDDTEILPSLESIHHPELIENLHKIANQISYLFQTEDDTFAFPEDYFDPKEAQKRLLESIPVFQNAEQTLRQLAWNGLESRKAELEDINAAKDRVEYELNDIIAHHWENIFLLHYELCFWCTQNGIEHGPGRGSAPGSFVLYLLGITNVNPLKYGLHYERFLNPERSCYPDFDIDYEYERLDEVVNHLKEKYGITNVARIVAYASISCKQAFKVAGKYLNYPDEKIQSISKIIQDYHYRRLSISKLLDFDSYFYRDTISHWDGVKLQGFLRDKKNEKLVRIATCLENVKCHRGLHASGYVITKIPVSQYVPVLQDERSGCLYSEYTFDILDSIGLYKNDLLGLKELTKLKQLSNEISKTENKAFDYKAIPVEDEKTLKAFAKGSTTDIFHFESPGMMKTLKKFKPESFSDLVLMDAMYCPGLMDYIPSVMEAKESEEYRTYHINQFPDCEEILKESYGIIVYQEQIMQMVQELVGYTLGEADVFRRVLARKKLEDLLLKKEEFINKARLKGKIDDQTAENIFETMIPFAGYGFNKSHAVSYTLMAWWEMYIKVHYPKEYKKVAQNFKDDFEPEED